MGWAETTSLKISLCVVVVVVVKHFFLSSILIKQTGFVRTLGGSAAFAVQ